MSDIDYINREIDTLEKLACKIEENAEILFKNTPLLKTPSFTDVLYTWQIPVDDDLKTIRRTIVRDYENFYAIGLQIVKEFRPEKEIDFFYCYKSDGSSYSIKGVLDYLDFCRSYKNDNKDEIIKKFDDQFEKQRCILLTIPALVKHSEYKLREIISADFIDREIEQSEYLYEKGFERAAGALAGVALEQYLRTQCDKHQIDYNRKETMVPLVQKLYEENKIDLILKKKIEHLASIRNSCDHPSEVNKGQVRELIENVKKIV